MEQKRKQQSYHFLVPPFTMRRRTSWYALLDKIDFMEMRGADQYQWLC